MSAAQLQAFASVGTLLVAAATAAFALRQFRLSRSTREEQTNPYVIAYVELRQGTSNVMDFVVKNIGSTPAFDIRLQIQPPMVRADESDGFHFMESKIIADDILMLVPQQEYRVFFDNVIERLGRDLPNTYEVAISAKTSRRKMIETQCTLDIDWGRGSLF